MAATAAPCWKRGTNRGRSHEAAQYIKLVARGWVEHARQRKSKSTLTRQMAVGEPLFLNYVIYM